MLVVPEPRLAVDRLTDGAEDSERRKVIVLYVFSAETTEETDCCGCGVKLGDLVFINRLPVAGGCWIDGSGFEDTVISKVMLAHFLALI